MSVVQQRHVAIDVRMLRHAGIGRYVSMVVPRVIAARPDWRFTLLTPADAGDAATWASSDAVQLVPCRSDIYSIAEQIEVAARIPSSASVVWVPHYNVPILTRKPIVATVHDVAHLVMDTMPATAATNRSGPGAVARQAYARGMFGTVRRRARAIFFNSEFTRAEFTREVGAPHASEVTHLAVAPRWASLAERARPHARPYLLFVGSIKPHKNLPRLLQAFRSIADRIEHDLVLAGGWKGQRTVDGDALALAGASGDRIHIVESPTDAVLATYMAHAAGLVLPSLYEGFGLPALEAMSLGCPCVVSNVASLPEVCGAAALYVDPMNVDDIAAQMLRLLSDDDLRMRLAADGRARASTFDWSTTAEQTARVIGRVMDA